MNNAFAIILAFVIGTLLGWVLLTVGSAVLGAAITVVSGLVMVLFPILVVVAIFYIVWCCVNKNNKEN